MSKKKKRKKTGISKQGGGYKKFLLDMQEVLNQANLNVKIREIPHEFKRMMYDFRIRIANPKAANALVSSHELKNITQKTKSYYREKNVLTKQVPFSSYQLMLLHCYTSVWLKMMKKDLGNEDPLVKKNKKLADDSLRLFHTYFVLGYFRIMTQLSNPCYKYFGLHIRPAAIVKDNPMMEMLVDIYGVPAKKLFMQVDGISRPTYRLGMATAKEPVEWISVDSSLLGDYYKGDHKELEVYIQSHVMERLSQRLDLLDKAAINYLIWENTRTITQFEVHKGYLLLPVKLYGVKVGYFLAKIVDDKILFRTFLFITHSFTPEGDRLAEISGLGKHDITYWRIDRLSSFVNLDETNYQELLELFRQSGIEDFMKLKEQNFSIDEMQSVNLEGLTEYIRRSRGEDKQTE